MTREEHRVGDVWRHASGHEMRVAEVQRSSLTDEIILIAADGEGGGRPEFFAHNGYRRVPRAEVDLAEMRKERDQLRTALDEVRTALTLERETSAALAEQCRGLAETLKSVTAERTEARRERDEAVRATQRETHRLLVEAWDDVRCRGHYPAEFTLSHAVQALDAACSTIASGQKDEVYERLTRDLAAARAAAIKECIEECTKVERENAAYLTERGARVCVARLRALLPEPGK